MSLCGPILAWLKSVESFLGAAALGRVGGVVLAQGHWILGFGAGGFVGAFACHCRVLVCGGSWALGCLHPNLTFF